MAKKEQSAPVKKKKGSKAVTVFNIIFIVLFVIVAVAAVLMLTPLSHYVKDFLNGQSWFSGFSTKFIDWVKYHLVDNLNLTMPFRRHSEIFTASLYSFLYICLLLGLLFLCYTPFLVMNHNRKLGRKEGFRKALCWITFIVSFIVFLGYLSIPFTQKVTDLVGKYYSWFPATYEKWMNLFKTGNTLAVIRLSFLSTNLWFNATFYILVMLVIFQIIFYIMACKIKGKKTVEVEEEAKAAEDEPATVVAAAIPVAAAAAETVTPEEKPAVETVRVAPTIRELAIINSLEPIEASPISNLPGLYDTEVDKLIELLEPQKNEELAHEEEVNRDAIEAKKLSDTIQPDLHRSVKVLPGIDEWDANPWHEQEKKNEEVTVLPGIDENNEDPWAKEKPVEESVVEEPAKEEPVAEPITESSDITDVVAPTEENVPVVEEIVEEKVEEKAEEPVVEEVVEEKVEETEEPKGAVTKAVNFIEDDGKRPQEEEHEPVVNENTESRLDHKQVVTGNSHEEVKTEKFHLEKDWILPEYVPEEKPAVEETPVVEEKPVEEKPAAPAPAPKPVANVKQVELKNVPAVNKENKPRITPIAPITPVAPKAAPVEEEKPVEEKPVLTPISGPLHSTAKSKHDKIEAVKAQKVRFELKNYQIKTYQGDLSAEEAFKKGVTKVQPTVNPIFANQSSEPEWKQKRRNEDIRKNGYTNVTTVNKLNGNVPATPVAPTTGKSATSIRDLVKAQKASNATAAENVEKKDDDKKIAKPTAPINFKPVEPIKPEEKKDDKLQSQNPFSDKQTPAFHPIAPINKKPGAPRAPIKPVDPLKKK